MDIRQTRKHARDTIWYLNLLQFDAAFNPSEKDLLEEDCSKVLKWLRAWKSDVESFRAGIRTASSKVKQEFLRMGIRRLVHDAARQYAMLERMDESDPAFAKTTDAIIDILALVEKKMVTFSKKVKTLQV